MEAPDEMGHLPVTATPANETGYSGVPAAEQETLSVQLSASGQMTSLDLPENGAGGGGAGDEPLTPLPRPSSHTLRPEVVDTLSALSSLSALSTLSVEVTVPPPVTPADPDDPVEPASEPVQPELDGPTLPTASETPVPLDAEHCLVCNSRLSAGGGVTLFDPSGRPVTGALEAAVGAVLDPLTVHSQLVCAACYQLSARLERLQEELLRARNELRRLFWHTIRLYPVRPRRAREPPPEQQTEEPRRRPQRAATQHGPGHYRSMAEGQPEPPPPPPEAEAADESPEPKELDIDIHVENASFGNRKRSSVTKVSVCW